MKPYTPTQLHDMATRRGIDAGPRPVERKRRSHEESIMQRQFIKHWAILSRQYGVPEILLASIPNGGGRSGPVVGSILKAEGLRKGFPDLGLFLPRGIYGALFIEFKTATGRLSPEQEVYHEVLQKHGYMVRVCRSVRDCLSAVSDYMKL